MATFIKAGFWETLCKKCTGYKGWLNLDQFVEDKINSSPGGLGYKVYTALLTEIEANNPIALVLENTLGESLSLVQDNTGIYKFTSPSGIFNKSKTFCTASFTADTSIVYGQIGPFCGDDTIVWLYTYNSSGVLTDFNTSCYDIMIEIRVYP